MQTVKVDSRATEAVTGSRNVGPHTVEKIVQTLLGNSGKEDFAT